MKNMYILALGLLLSLGSWAQTLDNPVTDKGRQTLREKPALTSVNGDREIFWSNDISSCADWSFANGSAEEGEPWEDINLFFGWLTPVDTMGSCSFEGPSGDYNGWAGGTGNGDPAPAINSTSVDNGFLMVDSDLFGADANYSADWVENTWVQTVAPINCAAHPFVSIGMQTRYRCWDNGVSDGTEKCFVEISRDGETWPSLTYNYDVNDTLTLTYVDTWAEQGKVVYGTDTVQCRYNVFPYSETGFETDNPSFVDLNISEAAGGQEYVWIRFRWVGTWGYSWEIDDIELFDTPENDVRIDNYVSFSNFEQTGYYEYGAWNEGQIPEDLSAGVKVFNAGYADQHNVLLELDVNGALFYSDTIEVFQSGAYDTLEVNYQPPGVGVVNVNYSILADEEDENPENNLAEQSYEVIDELQFGRDEGVIGGHFPTNDEDAVLPYVALVPYDIVNDVTIYAIDVAVLAPGAVEGYAPDEAVPMIGSLYDMSIWNEDDNDDGIIVFSDELALEFEHLNDIDEESIIWYTFVLDEPYEATEGEWIGAGFDHYGGSQLLIGASQFSYDQTVFYYGPFGSNGATDWFYTNTTPMVRLNLDPAATNTMRVETLGEAQYAKVFPAYPNPATGATRIQFELLQAAQVSWELRDMTGKVVKANNMGNQAAGYNSFELSTSDLQAGMYTVSLTLNGSVVTQQLMVH